MEYYDLKKHWRKVRRHLDQPEVQKILVRDFNRFTWGRWRENFKPGMLPSDFECIDWRWQHRGRPPAFWRYVACGACHWLVNFSLRLAEHVEPTREWRIITSDKHSTAWDGERLLFEFNYQALSISPQKCFDLAYKEELAPGKLRVTSLPNYWKPELRH